MASIIKIIFAAAIAFMLLIGITAAISLNKYFDEKSNELEQKALTLSLRKNQLMAEQASLQSVNNALLNEMLLAEKRAEIRGEQRRQQAQLIALIQAELKAQGQQAPKTAMLKAGKRKSAADKQQILQLEQQRAQSQQQAPQSAASPAPATPTTTQPTTPTTVPATPPPPPPPPTTGAS